MTVIDAYLKKIELHQRTQLERIRTIAKQTVPDSVEVISYGMPTLQYKGKSFLGFDAHKNHIGIYPYGGGAIAVFKNKLTAYGLSTGAIRVPYHNPISEQLLKEIILFRIKKITDQH